MRSRGGKNLAKKNPSPAEEKRKTRRLRGGPILNIGNDPSEKEDP